MCLPDAVSSIAPALISAAIATGGSLYNANQQQKQQNDASAAASRATLNNLARQKAEAERSKEVFAGIVPQQAKPQQDVRLSDATQRRDTAINANVKQERDYAPTPGSAPKVVRGAQDRAAEGAKSKLSAENAALAKMGAWGDAQQQNRFDIGRAGGQIEENNSFVRGVAGLLPGEQQRAVDRITGKPLSPWGDVAMAAGNAGVSATYPQAPMPTFADVLGMSQQPRAKRPKRMG